MPTPRTIPAAVRSARARRARTCRSASEENERIALPPGPLGLERGERLRHALARSALDLADHAPVAQEDDAVGDRRDAGVVGDHHDGLPLGVAQLAQELQDL